MRELTGNELDAVGGGGPFNFMANTLTNSTFHYKKIKQSMGNALSLTQTGGLTNTATVTQVNVAIGSIV